MTGSPHHAVKFLAWGNALKGQVSVELTSVLMVIAHAPRESTACRILRQTTWLWSSSARLVGCTPATRRFPSPRPSSNAVSAVHSETPRTSSKDTASNMSVQVLTSLISRSVRHVRHFDNDKWTTFLTCPSRPPPDQAVNMGMSQNRAKQSDLRKTSRVILILISGPRT